MRCWYKTIRWTSLAAVILIGVIGTTPAYALSRIKDLAEIEGVRENLLVGYGLVVGLQGSGDSLRNSPFTRQSLESMLERLGMNTRGTNLNTKNVAAVMVTGNLPPFAGQGSRMDITVSALGDAKSLQGGMLLVTPLVGADGEIYAVAQGPVAIGGFEAEGAAATVSKGVPTSGRIANGAIIEREVDFALAAMSQIKLTLRNPDLTTADRVARAINTFIDEDAAEAVNPSTVTIEVPKDFKGNIIALLTEIEQLRVEPTRWPAW